MFRADFFYQYFKYKLNNSNKIIKYNSHRKSSIEDQINTEIIEIEKKISEDSQALLDAKFIQFRSAFSKSNNFLEKLQTNIYKNKVQESIDWHQNSLKKLYFQRNKLKMNLEKIQGIYWINRIKRSLKILLIGFVFLLVIFIILSGFMIMIYFLPLIIVIYLCYLLTISKF